MADVVVTQEDRELFKRLFRLFRTSEGQYERIVTRPLNLFNTLWQTACESRANIRNRSQEHGE